VRNDEHSSTEAAPRLQPRTLTPDNPQLSRPTNGVDEAESEGIIAPDQRSITVSSGAINCANNLDALVQRFVETGIAPATRRAYRADLDHFAACDGAIPESDAELAAYIAAPATTLKVATLIRRLAAISVASEAHGLPNPVRSPSVRATMRGIRRKRDSVKPSLCCGRISSPSCESWAAR